MLLLVQTVAICVLFVIVFPIFYALVTHLSSGEDLAATDQILIVISAFILHSCY
jgi:ABC-type glycerol-3-phosphate transport system permease component